MPADLTLTPADHAVLVRIPHVWWDENLVGCEIAQALHTTSGDVLRRIARFKVRGLVERRGGRTLAAQTEIRKVGRGEV